MSNSTLSLHYQGNNIIRRRKSLKERYFSLWAFFLPTTSVLLVSSIQGTTPAYVMALGSLFFVAIISIFSERKYFASTFWIIFGFFLLTFVAQLSLSFSGIDHFINGTLIDPLDSKIILKTSLFTQSIYLIAGIMTFVYVKQFYQEEWDKYIHNGALFLVSYGVYEFIYFLIFKQNGDFLSNRLFDGTTGSWFQTYDFGPFKIMRIKSLTGEPSMYAFTLLPLWIYALHTGRKITHILFLSTLIISTSATAVIGIITYFLLRIRYYGLFNKFTIFVTSLSVLICIFYWDSIYPIIKFVFIDKITGESFSGEARTKSMFEHLQLFWDLPVMNQIFGVGFGYFRSTDLLSTLLLNTGLLGLLLFSIVLFVPIIKLNNTEKNIGLKCALIVIYVTSMICVPEFSILTTWLFLGIAYNIMLKQSLEGRGKDV